MAFVANRNQQIPLDDSTFGMSDRERRFLNKGWSEAFSKHIFPKINEDRFAVLFSDNPASRPNTPVNIIIGMLILEELFSHTDNDLLETMLFDVRYQYALHTTTPCIRLRPAYDYALHTTTPCIRPVLLNSRSVTAH